MKAKIGATLVAISLAMGTTVWAEHPHAEHPKAGSMGAEHPVAKAKALQKAAERPAAATTTKAAGTKTMKEHPHAAEHPAAAAKVAKEHPKAAAGMVVKEHPAAAAKAMSGEHPAAKKAMKAKAVGKATKGGAGVH